MERRARHLKGFESTLATLFHNLYDITCIPDGNVIDEAFRGGVWARRNRHHSQTAGRRPVANLVDYNEHLLKTSLINI